jgi:hypothetical protein
VHVSEHSVFRHALQSLSLEMHEAKACTVGNNQMVGSVCIDVQAHGQYPNLDHRNSLEIINFQKKMLLCIFFEQNITYTL